jgi:hypothetical protein
VLTTLESSLTILCENPFVVTIRRKRVLIVTRHNYHITTVTAITTVWAAFIYKFFITKANVAVATVAGFYVNCYFIYKHDAACSSFLVSDRRH